jgi:DNA-binding Lrp family transcriptional regulator
LGILQRDGSTPYAELGAMVGLSASAINDRLKRLKAKGALKRITAEVAPEALDLGDTGGPVGGEHEGEEPRHEVVELGALARIRMVGAGRARGEYSGTRSEGTR